MTNSTFNRRRIGESINKIYLDLVSRPSQWSTQTQAPIVGPGQSSKKGKCDDQSSTKRLIDHQCWSRFKSYNCLETPSGHGFQAHWVIGSIINVNHKEYTLFCSARDDVCVITTDVTLVSQSFKEYIYFTWILAEKSHRYITVAVDMWFYNKITKPISVVCTTR